MSSLTPPTISEGFMSWTPPNLSTPCQIWYKIYGTLHRSSPNTLGTRPLVVLHGGPGLTSAYVSPLSSLTTTLSIPVIIYNQLGNGRSTHLPDKPHDTTFWVEDLFLLELKLLLEHLGVYDKKF